MSRVTKVIGFSVPPSVAKQVDRISRQESRTKSELFREMVRVYERYRRQRDEVEERRVSRIFEEVQREERASPTDTEEILAESRRLAAYGERQARKLGIKTDEAGIEHVIHASRARRRT